MILGGCCRQISKLKFAVLLKCDQGNVLAKAATKQVKLKSTYHLLELSDENWKSRIWL